MAWSQGMRLVSTWHMSCFQALTLHKGYMYGVNRVNVLRNTRFRCSSLDVSTLMVSATHYLYAGRRGSTFWQPKPTNANIQLALWQHRLGQCRAGPP